MRKAIMGDLRDGRAMIMLALIVFYCALIFWLWFGDFPIMLFEAIGAAIVLAILSITADIVVEVSDALKMPIQAGSRK